MRRYLSYLIPNSSYHSQGLLLLRIIGGLMMVSNHGWGKITAGPEKWDRIGHALTDIIGFEFLSTFFGFMAAFSESVCALLIVFGLFTRPASILLMFTMFVASMNHVIDGEIPELAIMYFAVTLVLILIGPGKFSLDYRYFSTLQN
ncbi:MAG: DoxX family protein [Candidatus Neomarinimicrobiota bacterium]|nr:MAG: DoxX family protein [Candidatus Neomarinimicrobiota bacterium]